MKLSARILTASCVVVLLGSVGVPSTFAATTVEAECRKVGATQVTSKGLLSCMNVSGARIWISTPLPKGIAEAKKLVSAWDTSALPTDSIIRFHARSSDDYVQQRLTLAQQKRDALVGMKASLTARISALQSEIGALPSQISVAQVASRTALSNLETPKREYQTLTSQANIYYSQYARLDSARISHLGCKILEMFGMGGSCGTFNESAYYSAKTQYELAKYRADTAEANYNRLFNDYKVRYDAYKALFDRRATAQSELSVATNQGNEVEAGIPGAEAHLKASHAVIADLRLLQSSITLADSAGVQLQELVQKPLGANWKKKFDRLARVNAIRLFHQGNVDDTFSSFRTMTPDLLDPEPEVPPTAEPSSSPSQSPEAVPSS